jgi:YgiT-type zinc finger domain-containing protein
MAKCFFCKGDKAAGFTTHVADLGKCCIIVRNVPCEKCEQCGEVTYDGEVTQQLENIVERLQNAVVPEIAVVNYSDRVA